jgi:hypothetical protein
MILIKPKDPAPTTSLAEKASGFKFKMPEAKTKEPASTPASATVDAPAEAANPVGDTTVAKASNATGLLIGKKEAPVKVESAPLIQKPTTNIPQMSDDKYEVVADSVPEFTETSGDAFQQQLSMLQDAIDGTGDLKNQMAGILTFLDDNPQFKTNIGVADVAVFVAGCRKVAGITVTEKVTRKTKVKKADAKVEAVMADLADLDLDLFG